MELSSVSCYPLYPEDSTLSSISSPIPSKHAEWTSEEDKIFEQNLAFHDLNALDLFEKIATKIPGKTIEQIKEHFQQLVEDVNLIETYRGPLPNYKTFNKKEHEESTSIKTSLDHQQKRKGTRWTKEEHENFLIGLEKYGKGDWRSISKNSVMTKTPTQVASHAQKYFIRLAKLSTISNPLKFSTSHGTSKSVTAPSHTSRASNACIVYQSPTTVTFKTENLG
ncbi:hypothetical protein ACH5RR_011972 [Cinchona calisaya]|uniref:Uncharacterized protein n=1 Tax=Cinchona calisaya TaxID=153742 RepID=A0ABD3A6F3_9GENT